MKVAFFSHANSIDYRKVGGLESFFRRLAGELIKDGYTVEFVLYGAESETVQFPQDRMLIRYFVSYKKSISYLRRANVNVISNYLRKRHRFRFWIFRFLEKERISFYRINSGANEYNFLKRSFSRIPGLEKVARLFESQIALSKTIQENLKMRGISAELCHPPIPEIYFTRNQKKILDEKLEVTFVGRMDENKGISNVLELFECLTKERKIKCNISGYFGHGLISRKAIKNFLTMNPEVHFNELSWTDWNGQVDSDLIKLLDRSDILVLPYKNLRGTMDPPYLVLEGMAARCVILTTNVGSIPDYLADTAEILDENIFVRHALEYIHIMDDDRVLLSTKQDKNQRLIKNKTCDLGYEKTNKWAELLCKRNI